MAGDDKDVLDAGGIDVSTEDEYWQGQYSSRPYARQGRRYEEFRPAYQYGWESYGRWGNRNFEDVEPDLRHGWEAGPWGGHLSWDEAREATRDAWRRLSERDDAPPRVRG